ncbi:MULTISPECIES: peptidoglycan-associated lipoprotein Pal [Lentibacter]|jgi:peptidoglycan-associated lipoprotein|uniref:peptidoglycan-associated lipoprotein Pal n=1 Tax=Lentibacter TaxID=1434014 RepID=UPI00260ADD84|nr:MULTISPECIES: peptidoglycan-associated lipoprotein Pal [Lentibacter]MCH9825049.1 peptidoglycan-associated lipoprotein Pal [Alphaproteobacteria bacterium]MDG1289784.1 peptidoglycan-associated lipoprotein Pal [Lentibacter sp.]
MKLKLITLVIPAVLALSACTNPNRFDNGADGAGTFSSVTPGSAQDPQSPLYFQETIGDRVLFDVDQSSLNDEARRVLDGQASWLTTNADYAVVIEGHADEQGTREYNLALGARRANAVKEYLLAKGMPSSRLKTVSYGKERPLEICSQEACYSKNRRAVTILSSGLSS